MNYYQIINSIIYLKLSTVRSYSKVRLYHALE